MKNIRNLMKWSFIAYFIPTFLLGSCVTQRAVTSYNELIPGGNGAVLVQPRWEYEETGASKAMPYILGAAGGAAGYLLTPEPPPKPTVVTTGSSQKPEEGDPRFTNGLIGAVAGYLLPLAVKMYLVKEKKKNYVPTEKDAKKWLEFYNKQNDHTAGNAYQLYRNQPSTLSLIMMPKDLMPKDPKTAILPTDNPLPHINIAPLVFFDNQIFPSFVISTSTTEFKEYSGALGIVLSSTYAGLPIKYEIECVDKRFFDKIQGEYITQNTGKSETISPHIPWKYEVLQKQITSTPIGVYFRIYDRNGAKKEVLENIQLRSINDCLYYYVDKEKDKALSLQFMFAAYVNEEHPKIDELLKEGMNKKYIDSWGGGALETPQVKAIWRVLKDKGIKYSSITTVPDSEKSKVRSQAVRQFSDAINNKQANCVDGTIVFASILRKIGISPFLVLIPGHAFLGYYGRDSEDSKEMKMFFLETTMLGSKATFEDAMKQGMYNVVEAAEKKQHIEKIDISKYREIVKPLGTY